MPVDIPITAWEQIPVVIIFALLLGGMAWLMVRAFSNAVAEINAHYALIVENSNKQWQIYFDAKNETSKLINDETISKISELAKSINNMDEQMALRHQALLDAHEEHDIMVRGALDAMAEKRAKLAKVKNAK